MIKKIQQYKKELIIVGPLLLTLGTSLQLSTAQEDSIVMPIHCQGGCAFNVNGWNQ